MIIVGNRNPRHTYRRRDSSRRRLSMRRGSLLLEAIIAIGVFSLFLGGIGLSLVLGERSTIAAGDRARASFLAEQQLEAVRQMRQTSFASVTAGAHGLKLGATGWSFSGTSVLTNGFRSSVNVTSQASDWLQVSSTVTWNFKNTRSGSVVLTTYLTDWRKVQTVGNWAAMSRIANIAGTGTPDYQKIAISGVYAFITGTKASAGKGLYIYDITNPASPVRVNSSFDLGAGAYGLIANGNRLYIATDSTTSEVQVYDISAPSTLTTGNLVNSYDLPGSGKARSINLYGDTVYVGTLDDPPNKQFYTLQMSETGPMTLLDSLGMSGSVLDISLRDGYAYAATAYNAGELQVADIFDPEHLAFAPGAGLDITDVQDANAILTSGSAAIIGRTNGSTISELTMYTVADAPVPAPPPGPWTWEIGGDVLSLSNIYGSTYLFVCGSASSAQIRVLDTLKLEHNQSPVVQTYNASATVKGSFYDWQKDRFYAVTASNLMVFSPG